MSLLLSKTTATPVPQIPVVSVQSQQSTRPVPQIPVPNNRRQSLQAPVHQSPADGTIRKSTRIKHQPDHFDEYNSHVKNKPTGQAERSVNKRLKETFLYIFLSFLEFIIIRKSSFHILTINFHINDQGHYSRPG